MQQDLDDYGLLDDYIVSIDSIEKITGLDMFSNLYGNWDEEIRLEKQANKNSPAWPFNDRWHQQRKEQAERN